ncbi:unnamed protein product [Discosporangium mesarthrocarpum]
MTYVDDILLMGNDQDELILIKRHLLRKYEGRDFGTLNRMLGVNISITEQSISLNQQVYSSSIVTKGWGRSKCAEHLSRKARRRREYGRQTLSTPHIRRKLMFLAGMTRPDLSNSVRELGRRTSVPCLRHWKGLQHTLHCRTPQYQHKL